MSEHKGWAAGVMRRLDALEQHGTSPFHIITRTRADRWMSLLVAVGIMISLALNFLVLGREREQREAMADYFQMLAYRIQPASCPVPQGFMVPPLPSPNRTIEQ